MGCLLYYLKQVGLNYCKISTLGYLLISAMDIWIVQINLIKHHIWLVSYGCVHGENRFPLYYDGKMIHFCQACTVHYQTVWSLADICRFWLGICWLKLLHHWCIKNELCCTCFTNSMGPTVFFPDRVVGLVVGEVGLFHFQTTRTFKCPLGLFIFSPKFPARTSETHLVIAGSLNGRGGWYEGQIRILGKWVSK